MPRRSAALQGSRTNGCCSGVQGAKLKLREPTYLREGTLGENTGSRSESVRRRVDHEEMAAKRQRCPPTDPGRTGEAKGTHISKQVLPQAPSPTMTSFLRSSAAMVAGRLELCDEEGYRGGFGDAAAG